MILRRYGTSVHSVELNFNPAAMTEIGFRRDQEFTLPVDDFTSDWEKVEERSFAPTAEGRVQIETDRALLAELESGIRTMEETLEPGEVLYLENEHGTDYPKVSDTQKDIVEDHENVIHFSARVHPPLRMGRYRKR